MAQEAVQAYIESLQKDGLPIPADKPPVNEQIRVLLPEAS
jgi:predicted RNase H-like HicB family nuclease